MMELPLFETERLILRRITEEDMPAWRQHTTDYEVIIQLARDSFQLSPESLLPVQEKRWVWGIFLKSQLDKLIGVVYLLREGTPGNRHFWLAKEHWGKGIMTEAVAPVMQYAFNVLNFNKLIFGNALGNTQSRRIKEKNGAVLIRVEPVPQSYYANPEYKERELWELTKERWATFKAL